MNRKSALLYSFILIFGSFVCIAQTGSSKQFQIISGDPQIKLEREKADSLLKAIPSVKFIPSAPIQKNSFRRKEKQILSDTLLKKSISARITDSLKQRIPSKDSLLKNSTSAISKKADEAKTRLQKYLHPEKIVKSTLASFLNNNSTHGSITIGYDYGVVPFVSNGPIPSGYLRAEGNGSLKIFSLPFNASFFYSDIKSVAGLTNYYRLTYDETKFKQELTDKISEQTEGIKKEVNSLYSEKQKIEQKLYYYKSLPIPKIDYNLPDNPLKDISKGKVDLPISNNHHDLKGGAILGKYEDSLLSKVPDTVTNSLKAAEKIYKESVNKLQAEIQKADSIKREIKKYEDKLKEYETKIKDLNSTLEILKDRKNIKSYVKTNNRYVKKLFDIFSNIKKFEIGMCYPNYSTFLVNGVAIKGINVEYQKNDLYLAFTHGSTINTMLFTNNAIQNRLSNMQNLYNFFDFNYAGNSRSITAVKFGYGKKESSHLYFGLLYGIGLPSYLSNTIASTTFEQKVIPDKNYVSEIDGKYVINKNSSLDIVYGKSTLQTNSQYLNTEGGGFNSLFNSQQSNAVMGKYILNISKTKTKLTATGRWVDPFFKSYGVGFMRSDNFRCEAKVEQPIGNKIKFTGFYRNDEDNLLALYNYKTVLRTIGTNLSIKIKRSLTLRLGFSPVIQTVRTTDNSYSSNNVNSISNAIITYNPALKHGSSTFNFMYNYYHLTTGGQTSTFENITLTNLTQFQKGFKNNFTASWFRSSSDTLNNNTWLLTDELSYVIKKGWNVSGGLKAAYNPSTKWQYGYMVKASLPLINHISLELSAEKLVAGDFYNSLNYLQVNKFPYYLNSKLVINW